MRGRGGLISAKGTRGIYNYRVLFTPHVRFWDFFSYMCPDFGSITGGTRTSGGTGSSFLPRILRACVLTTGVIFQASPGRLTRSKSRKEELRAWAWAWGRGSEARRGEERRFRFQTPRVGRSASFPLSVLRRRHRTLGNPAPI